MIQIETDTVTLYPYQQEAVERMIASESFLLADEMGLGKTVCALWEIRERGRTQGVNRVLVVCPKSVISVWQDHIEWLLPKAEVYSSAQEMARRPLGQHIQFVVTNYEQVRINNSAYLKVFWDYVISDEAHYLKNRKALRTRATKRLRAKYKRALSGTPMVNRPDELWSILNWLYPSKFKSYWRYFEYFVRYVQLVGPHGSYKKIVGPKNTSELKEILEPFMLRRLKRDVLKELPEKYYTHLKVEMSPQQRRAYEEMRKESLAWVGAHEDEPVPAPMVVARLTRLRQFAAAYAFRDDEGNMRMAEPSCKLDALMELLEDTEEPIVVYSQFKQMIKMAERRLDAAKVPYVSLTGDTPNADRGRLVERFQSGKARVFLGTTKAGGVGITLHRASTVVFLDRSWSPADNLQAEDRLHRIGQKNAVQVIIIQSDAQVDKDVEKKLDLKWSWIRTILGG
jgi:SNF2 family DNA or RNA helicase